MARQKFSIPFGAGVDRHSGIAVADPSKMRDVRNLILSRGRARARDGYVDLSTAVTTDGRVCDVVLDIRELPSEFSTIITAYHPASKEVWIFRGDSAAANLEPLGIWFVNTAGETPRVISCEVFGLVFLAHDERRVNHRAITYRYDSSEASVLAELTVSWRDTSDPADGVLDPEPVRFRGVVEHLGYLVGWGWGTPDDEDRPEVLRHSRPESALLLEPNDYGLFGSQGDPILCCGSGVGSGLLVQKRKQTHVLSGYGSRTFRPDLVDARFGSAGGRLGIEVGGAWYVWTLEGPAVTTGGPLELLSLPLDLGGPEPADLIAMGAVADGFAIYVPGLRLIQWVFGRRVYSLSILEPGSWEWSYYELADEVRCGATLQGLVTTAPTGYPDAEPVVTFDHQSATIPWLNIGADGDEFCEVWLLAVGGTWTRHGSARVVGAAQELEVSALISGTDYDYALRYSRGSVYTAGYEGADPALWPAISRGTFTTAIGGSSSVTSTWTRTSATDEEIELTFVGFDPTATITVFRREYGSGDPWTELTASPLAAGTATFTDAWTDVDARGEKMWEYKATETIDGSTRDNLHTRWAGPDAPTLFAAVPDSTWYRYDASWTDADALSETDIRDNYYCTAEFQHRSLIANGVEFAGSILVEKESALSEAGGEPTWPTTVRAWHKRTTFGVVDWSPYVESVVEIVIAADETANGSCGGAGSGGGGGTPPDFEEPV